MAPVTNTAARDPRGVKSESVAIAFILERPVIERILTHVGEPAAAPEVLPARAPPQTEIQFNQATGSTDWPEMDQTAGESDDTWN